MSDDAELPPARTADPLPRTVLAWQRTLLAVAANTIVLSVSLGRAGHGLWAVPVLALAVAPVPAAVRRERNLLAEQPAPIERWKPPLLTGVVVLLAVVAGAIAVLL